MPNVSYLECSLCAQRFEANKIHNLASDVPQANFIECKALGADVTLVDGLISDCAKIVTGRKNVGMTIFFPGKIHDGR